MNFFEIGNKFGGTIVYSYVKWILEESQKREIKELYFLARDGYILKKIADYIIRVNKLDIETYYIYSSRISWRIYLNEKKYLMDKCNWIKVDDTYEVKQLEKILEIEDKIVLKYLPTKYKKEKLRVSGKVIKSIIYNYLLEEEIFKEIENKEKDKVDILNEYFEQEISKKNVKKAFIDTQGTGKTIRSVIKNLKFFKERKINCFYAYMDNGFDIKNCDFIVKYKGNVKHGYLIEAFTWSYESQTIGFKKERKIIPIFDGNMIFNRTAFDEYYEGVINFIQNIDVREDYNNLDDILLKKLEKNKELKPYFKEFKLKSYSYYGKKIKENYLEEDIKLKKDIILYGAGIRGKIVYKKLSENKEVNIITWVDKNPKDKNVESIDIINKYNFEQILVAIKSIEVFYEVKQKLISMGIDKNKIVWYTGE